MLQLQKFYSVFDSVLLAWLCRWWGTPWRVCRRPPRGPSGRWSSSPSSPSHQKSLIPRHTFSSKYAEYRFVRRFPAAVFGQVTDSSSGHDKTEVERKVYRVSHISRRRWAHTSLCNIMYAQYITVTSNLIKKTILFNMSCCVVLAGHWLIYKPDRIGQGRKNFRYSKDKSCHIFLQV